MNRLQQLLAAFILLCHGTALAAQPLSALEETKAADRAIDKIEQGLDKGATDTDLTAAWLQQLSGFKARADDCVVAAQRDIANTLKKIETLGAPVRGEQRDVARARAALNTAKNDKEKLLSSCQLLILRSDELAQKTVALQQNLLTRELLALGPRLNTLLKENLQQAPDWIAASYDYLGTKSGAERLTTDDLTLLGGLGMAGLGIGIALRRRLRHAAQPPASGNITEHSLYRAAARALARYLPALLASLLIAAFFYAFSRGLVSPPLISLAAWGLPVYILLLCLFRLFIATCPPTSEHFALPESIGKALARGLALLALLLYIGFLLFAVVYEQALPEPALLLLRALFIAVFALNLVWALWLLGQVPCLRALRWPRRSLELALLGIVTAEWLGYRNLSLAGARGLFGTLMLLGLATLLLRLLHELYDGLELGASSWQQRLRIALGIKPGATVPVLNWLRPLTTFVVWGTCSFGLLWVWGLSEVGFRQLRAYLMDGFAVGSLHIVPARIILAAFALTVLLGVSGWFKGRLERSWLSYTTMERSAREALVTVTGYAGTAVAVLVTLGIAGMEFANLAIVAGALSLGIGFGLQNIVNNFVSGLILLLERPIRTGDWIVAGDTEGHVVKISIRSTQIKTFDQADVIVPNSELISGKVTNWTLTDKRGRFRVPVRVAYAGNDPAQVRDLLLTVAQENPLLLKDGNFAPTVLFQSFSEGLLHFELRCHIANINQCPQVLSELNFAIDAAFRAAGIDVPPRAPAPAKHV